MTSVFETLNAIDCSEHIEQKNGLSYLSWAWAWQIAKKYYPQANYTIYENERGWNFFTDGSTCWVKTGVTIEGLEHIECLPVMNFNNKSIPYDQVTSFDVNKAIQRSLTKALARHGLGLYIYAGEDLPDSADEEKKPEKKTTTRKKEAYVPMDEDRYWKCVQAEAEGQLSKTGRTIKEVWISQTHAGKGEIERFEFDVANYRAANL